MNESAIFAVSKENARFRTDTNYDRSYQGQPLERRSIALRIDTAETKGVMVIMDQYTRRIIGFSSHAGNVEGPTLCRMLNRATSGPGWPTYISSDNDPLFQCRRRGANLRVLDIQEIKSLPHVPMLCWPGWRDARKFRLRKSR